MSEIDIQPLTQVEPRSVSWLWQPWLPLGKAVVLGGGSGLGTSLVLADLAARASRGKAMPDASAGSPRRVALLCAEDDWADTIAPRLRAAGADLAAVSLVGRVRDTKKGKQRLAQLPADQELLVEALRPVQPSLVIIDPIVPFISAGYSLNAERHVRKVMESLGFLAAELGACVLAVRPVNKGASSPALYGGSGHLGLLGGARLGLLVAAPNPASPDRLLSVLKSNLAPRPPSWVFRIAATAGAIPTVDWRGPVAADNDPVGRLARGGSAVENAALFLLEHLSAGPVASREIVEAASQAGISETVLYRGKDLLAAEHYAVVRDGKRLWMWKLRDANSARTHPSPPNHPDRPRTWADWGVDP